MNDVVASSAQLSEILPLIAQQLQVDVTTLTADTDLFVAGLDSIALMKLAAGWRAAGHQVDFATLARDPRASAWADYLALPPLPMESAAVTSAASLPANATQPFSLAPMQYAYWVGREPTQPLGGVSAHLYTEFQHAGSQAHLSPDPQRLAAALQQLGERHPSLRLQVTADGQQIQRPDGQQLKLHVEDLRHLSAVEADQRLEILRARYSAQMLDITAGEVLSIALSLLSDGNTRLHLDLDMICADAVSYRTLLRELALFCDDLTTPLAPLEATYRQFRFNNEQRWPSIQATDGHWWQQRLADLPAGPQLPLQPTFGDTPQTSRRHLQLNSDLRNALYSQCHQHGLTPAAVLATVLAETLAGWSSEARFLLNVPLFLRPLEGPSYAGVVGDFSSSVMLDVDLRKRKTFIEHARQLQNQLHQDVAHADYPGVQVLRDLGRLQGKQVTAPVVFTSALNLGELFDPAVRRVFGDPIWIISQGPQVLLDAQITELDQGILLNWDCREDAFVAGVLDAMFGYFCRSIEALAHQPAVWSTCLSDYLPAERVRPATASAAITSNKQTATPPRTLLERAVAALWTQVLGGDGQHIHLNLFAAGGDSVLANRLIAQIREIFGVTAIDMQRLFHNPTIAGIASAIANSAAAEHIEQIATIYCEILQFDDATLLAASEGAA